MYKIGTNHFSGPVEMQSRAMFARPSPPSVRGFAARPLDRPGGEGLVARLMIAMIDGDPKYLIVHCIHFHSAKCFSREATEL